MHQKKKKLKRNFVNLYLNLKKLNKNNYCNIKSNKYRNITECYKEKIVAVIYEDDEEEE